MMAANAVIIAGCVLAGILLASRQVAENRLWRATITPLASIIGSGFLILAPVLQSSYGVWGPAVMAALVATAWMFGAAVRRNIRVRGEGADQRPRWDGRLDRLASWLLAFAYIISVAYYLNLFGAFGVSLTDVADQAHGRLLTSAAFLLILLTGWTRGFSALEHVEQIFVSVKLAVITGLLAGLCLFAWGEYQDGGVVLEAPVVTGWHALTLAFGLIVTVQGFETSRYLGDTYSPVERIRTMRWAQYISAVIYLGYIGLVAISFDGEGMPTGETAIVDMMRVVAPILPVLLVGAALSSQLSAAVADTAGTGGLFVELSGNRLPLRLAYLILVGAGLGLTWFANLYEIIAYASRAFAAYYAVQSLIAARSAWRERAWIKVAAYGALTVLGVAITVFGTPAEG